MAKAKVVEKEKESTITRAEFVYDKDTKRTQRFSIGEYGDSISGTFYIPKGSKIPEKIILTLKNNEK